MYLSFVNCHCQLSRGFVLKAWGGDSLDLDMESVYFPTFPVKLS